MHTQIELPQLSNWGDGKWREQAACRGKGNTCFFPSKEHPELMQIMISESKLLCSKCPVRKECLMFALENGLKHGVYGGLAPRERRGMTTDKYDCSMRIEQIIGYLKLCTKVYKLPSKGIVADLAKHFEVSEEEARKMIANAKHQYV